MFGKGNPLVLFEWVINCSVFQKYKMGGFFKEMIKRAFSIDILNRIV